MSQQVAKELMETAKAYARAAENNDSLVLDRRTLSGISQLLEKGARAVAAPSSVTGQTAAQRIVAKMHGQETMRLFVLESGSDPRKYVAAFTLVHALFLYGERFEHQSLEFMERIEEVEGKLWATISDELDDEEVEWLDTDHNDDGFRYLMTVPEWVKVMDGPGFFDDEVEDIETV